MTVRVSKPEFNLREKITELDKPVGVKGFELMKSDTSQEVRGFIGTNSGRKNLLINGDMRIDQRSNGALTTPSGTGYTSVDRWKAVINPGSKFSMKQNSDGTVPGLPYYLRLTVTNPIPSMGSSQYQLLWQTIESLNMFDRTGFGYGADAKDLTLSFWVRSSVAGPFSGAMENYVQNRAFVWEVEIEHENTWEHKTVHIPGCTDGGWEVGDYNKGNYLMFSLGTTINGAANIGWVNGQQLGSNTDIRRIGIDGATLDLTGVQLELGKVATEFEHRPYGEELQLCMRYYQKVFNAQLIGTMNTSSRMRIMTNFPVPLRGTSGTYSRTSNNLSFQKAASNVTSSNTSEAQGGSVAHDGRNTYARTWDFGGFTPSLADRTFIGGNGGHVFNMDVEL